MIPDRIMCFWGEVVVSEWWRDGDTVTMMQWWCART